MWRAGALVVLALCAWLPRNAFTRAEAPSSAVVTSAVVPARPAAATFASVAWAPGTP